MKRFMIPMALVVMASAFVGAAGNGNVSANSDGKSLFKDNKCAKCHTIQSLGIERIGEAPSGKLPPDLSGVGLKHDQKWIEGWLNKSIEQNGKKHLKKWPGSEADLDVISKWLASLKKK